MRCLIFLFFLLVLSTALLSQDLNSLVFSQLSKNDGLSDNNVEVIMKDSDGFIWIGTRNGLCRFDGYEFEIYKKSESENSIAGNRILDLAEDDEGHIWIGTYKNGLSRLNKKTGQFSNYHREQGIGERVNRIKKLSNGSIWVCTNRGLARYKSVINTFQVYLSNQANPHSLYSDLVYDIIETSNGEIYVAPEFLGLQKMDVATGNFENVYYARSNELQTNYRKTIIEDSKGTLWIAAHNHGLCSYNPETKKSEIFTAQNSGLSTNVLMGNMALDNQKNLWLCTEEDGINIFNIETKQFSYLRKSLENDELINTNHIYTIYIDDDQLIWVGTFDKGINVYNPYKEKFKNSLYSTGDLEVLEGHSVLDIYEDSKQRVWVGTDGNGLYLFEKGKKPQHIFKGQPPLGHLLSSNIITAIQEDGQGRVLLGTYTGGLVSINTDDYTSKIYLPNSSKPNQLSSTNVWEITRDSKNRIWLGLLGTGVDLFLPEKEEFKGHGPYSPSAIKIDFPNVMVIEEDAEGDVWFGTEGNGLFILDGQTNKVFQIPNDTVYNIATEGIIKCIIQDKWGYLWIGTEDNGLFKFDKKNNRFKKIVVNAYAPSDPVLSLEEDNLGNIWIGTNFGLYRYVVASGKFNRFETEDGLTSNDMNPDASLKLSDGRIIAGTKNGADIIVPDEIQLNQTLPKIIFTRLTVLNKEVTPNRKINNREILDKSITYTPAFELTWKEKIFTIEFAALNYTLPQKCKYKYKLEGFDDNWVQTDASRRFASYSNLDPGEYTFSVLASNNDGKWGNNEASIKIKVMPPFYRTLAFEIALSLLIILLIYGIYRWRINLHKERFERKQREQKRKIMELENEKLEAELKKLAFNIINKNKLLIEQKNRIQNLSNKAKVGVKEGLQKIVESIDADLDEEKDWKYIEPQIDKAYNQFILKLKQKHPDLNANEIRIAAYIRMNLTTKEISEFMNKTQRAVENDRYRLRKKIGLEANDSMKDYFMRV